MFLTSCFYGCLLPMDVETVPRMVACTLHYNESKMPHQNEKRPICKG